MSISIDICVEPNSYCSGLELISFPLRGRVWSGERLRIPIFFEEEEIVGLSSFLPDGRGTVNVAPTEFRGDKGFVVWGDSGLGILGPNGEIAYGLHLLWIDDPKDLPPEVREYLKE